MGEALLERRWPRKRERQRTGSAAVRRPRSEPSGGARAVMFCVANARHGVRRSVRVAGHFPMQSIYCPCVPGHHKVAAAVTTARVWRRAAAGAEEARRRIAQARVDGGYWIEALEQRRERSSRRRRLCVSRRICGARKRRVSLERCVWREARRGRPSTFTVRRQRCSSAPRGDLGDLGGAFSVPMMRMGDKLGLYKALNQHGPVLTVMRANGCATRLPPATSNTMPHQRFRHEFPRSRPELCQHFPVVCG